MKNKKYICLFLIVIMITAPLSDFAVSAEGGPVFLDLCGNAVDCYYDSALGAITISGAGPMDNYVGGASEVAPWEYNSRRVNTVVIENGVTTIGSYAFTDHRMESFTIADTVTEIGEYAFVSCTVLSELIIPKNLTRIDETAFETLTTAGYRVDPENPNYSSDEHGVLFNKDKTLLIRAPYTLEGEYKVPDTVTRIADNAFAGTNITMISLPESLQIIGSGVFVGCSSLILTPHNSAFYAGSSENPYEILYSVEHTEMTECGIHEDTRFIYDEAFRGCKALTEITVPEGVTHIGDYAFFDCYMAKSLSLPDSLKQIGKYTFNFCHGIKELTVPEGVISIGDGAFYRIGELEKLSLPQSLEILGTELAVDCDYLSYNEKDGVNYLGNAENPYLILVSASDSGITEHTIPDSTRFIADKALSDCGSLTKIVIGDGVTEIGAEAFSGCVSLSEVVFGKNVKRISYGAFQYCNNIGEINLPASVSYIGQFAFTSKTVTSVFVPESVSYLSTEAFGCTALESVQIDSANPYYSSDDRGVVFNKDKTRLLFAPKAISGSYIVPETVKEIADSAFSDCLNLTDVVIPQATTHMGQYAFFGCKGLKSVQLGGVLSIAKQAFHGCSALTEITLPDGLLNLRFLSFYYCTSLSAVVIPESLRYIEGMAFDNCVLWHVLYKGTQEQWEGITTFHAHAPLENATIHCEAKGDEIMDVENKLCAICCTHNYDGSETVAADCGNEGYTLFTCTICGYSHKENIVPATGLHTYDDEKDPDCNVCGAVREIATGSNLGLVIGLIITAVVLIAAGVIIAVIVIKKKKK